MTTPNLGLPTITGNMTADVARDLNALAEDIDTKVPSLGNSNQDVNLVKALMQQVDTRTTELTFTNGDLTKVTEKEGTTVVKMTDLTFDAGVLTRVVETVGGKTITQTLNYDVNGNLQSVTRSVV